MATFAFVTGIGFSFFVYQFYLLPGFQQELLARTLQPVEPGLTGMAVVSQNGENVQGGGSAPQEPLQEGNRSLNESVTAGGTNNIDRIVAGLGCVKAGNPPFSRDSARRLVDREGLRDLAVAIVSSGGGSPAVSLHSYVHESIKYVSDPAGEYVASPCETVLSGGGDCEDQAILLASLLESVGIDSWLVWFPGEHVFVAFEYDDEAFVEASGMQGCENPKTIIVEGKKLMLADPTFAPCPGQIEKTYYTESSGSWSWMEQPEIFDV